MSLAHIVASARTVARQRKRSLAQGRPFHGLDATSVNELPVLRRRQWPVSEVLLTSTSFALISRAVRIRYYGLHTWLTDKYATRHHSADEAQWRRFLRRGEALFALICQHHTQETGVAGNRWATRCLQQHDATKPLRFAPYTDQQPGHTQYLQQKAGAFGAAYASQLLEVGLIQKADAHDLFIVVEPGKKGMAQTFDAEIGSAGKEFLRALDSPRLC